MTSKTHTECFVFEAYSGTPVLAGKYWLENGVGHFVYGKSYLSNPDAFAIDPLKLPLIEELYTPNGGRDRFGALDDAGVDNWGRKLITATHRRVPQNAVEWLLAASGRGVGSLLFSASRTALKEPAEPISVGQLEEYIRVVQEVAEGDGNADIPLPYLKLIEQGQSMGGARPKALVMRDGVEYIAKLNRRDDDLYDLSLVEHLTMELAGQCGIRITPTECIPRPGGGSILLVKRFDRIENSAKRIHYLSAHSLVDMPRIRREDLAGDYSYVGIAKKAMVISSSPQEDVRELFRRMVFNAMCGNSDDHMRNHGFIMVDRANQLYRLTTVFDVVPHTGGTPQMLAIGCGKEGRLATRENLLSRAESFYLTYAQAEQVLEEVQDCAAGYHAFFKNHGVANADLKRLEPCFALATQATATAVMLGEVDDMAFDPVEDLQPAAQDNDL